MQLSSLLADRAIEFVFDRPKQSVQLAPGIDRQTPATLMQVGVNVGRLVEMMGGPPVDADAFLGKVASLTRFAKTAGHVKLDFLRRHGRPAVREAFLLDRARLVLTPIGLDDAAISSTRSAAEFARDIVRTMRTAAEQDRPRVLPIQVTVNYTGEPTLPLPYRVRFAAMLQTASGAACLEIHGGERPVNAEDAAAAIEAARLSSISRLRFAHSYDGRTKEIFRSGM
jgi:hypothetical protein